MVAPIKQVLVVDEAGNVLVPVGREVAGQRVEVTVKEVVSVVPKKPLNAEEHALFIARISGGFEGEFPEMDDPPAEHGDSF